MARRANALDTEKRHRNVANIYHKLYPPGSKFKLEYDLPGLSFGDFTRTGRPGLWQILRVAESDRILFTSKQDKTKLMNDANAIFSVVGGTIAKFTRYFYSKAAINLQIRAMQRYGYIGNTSFSLTTDYTEMATGQLLFTTERLVVATDPSTRKSTQVPRSLLEWKNEKLSDKPFIPVIHFKEHSLCHRYITTIAASDMDHLYHSNQSVYYKFCLDAAYDAGMHGHLKNFQYDICDYEVEETRAKHLGETFAGDKIEVFVMEDQQDALVLLFEILKNNVPVFSLWSKFYARVGNSHL